MASPPDALRLKHRGDSHACRYQDSFRLPALGASVAEARRRVRTRLREWGVDDEVGQDTGLVVSELFTNAVRHTDSEKITCELWVTGRLLHLEVADQGCGLTEPRPRKAGVDEEGGRGLMLVCTLSDAWGVQPYGNGSGRIVWAELFHCRTAF